LRTDAERVYNRALRIFSEDELAECFAATHGVTMPSQSRREMKKDGRKLIEEFRKLAPARKPIRIQRWSLRRSLLTLSVAFICLLVFSMVHENLRGVGLLAPNARRASNALVTRAPLCNAGNGGAVLALPAQSVPSASEIPCVGALPLGWTFRHMDVRSGSTQLSLIPDVEGQEDVTVLLRSSCDTSGATQVPSNEVSSKRFERVLALERSYTAQRYYVFDGGCVTMSFDFTGPGRTELADEASLAISLISRAEIAAEYFKQTGIRL
jgi:hypothetical protein